MITARRIYDPGVSYLLAPWFICHDKTRVEIGEELYRRLEESPEDTYCVVIAEPERFWGFIIAYTRYDDVFIWQALALPGMGCSGEVFADFLEWAKGKGYARISCEARRNEAVKRLYGFKNSDNGELIKDIYNG